MSILDLSAEEYEMVKELAKLDNNQLGTSSGINGNDELTIRNLVLGSYDKATNSWSKAKKQNNTDWVNGTYTDKVSGETTGARKRYNEFLRDKQSGKYKGIKNYNGGEMFTSNYVSDGTHKKYLNYQGELYSTDQHGYSSASNSNDTRELITLLRFDQMVKETMEEKDCTKAEATKIVEKKYRTYKSSSIN